MRKWVVYVNRRGKFFVPFSCILLVLCVYWFVMSFEKGCQERLQTIEEDYKEKLNTLVSSLRQIKQHHRNDDNASRMYNLLREADKMEANNLLECSLSMQHNCKLSLALNSLFIHLM